MQNYLFALFGLTVWLTSCAGPVHQPQPLKPAELAKHIVERVALLVTLPEPQAEVLLKKLHTPTATQISLSTATPISADGYFLTTAHSVRKLHENDVSVVFYLSEKRPQRGRVEVIWKDEKADLALIRAPFATPAYYRWTPPGAPLPTQMPVVHGGLATGRQAQIGQILAGNAHRAGIVTHSLRLRQGDSGGPLITLGGELIAINRAVGYVAVMDTQFFAGSQSSRPNIAKIQALLQAPPRP